MSDRPLGDDWWLASDGKWYPPQSRPHPPPPPAPPGRYPYQQHWAPQRVGRGLDTAVRVFLYLLAAAAGLSVVAQVNEIAKFDAWERTGSFSSLTDLDDAEVLTAAFLVITWLIGLTLGILLIVWLNTAYRAAVGQHGATGRTWSSGWAVGGWFIPFANAVIPRLVLGEIERVSHPDNGPPPIETRWKAKPLLASGMVWWIGTVIGMILLGAGAGLAGEELENVLVLDPEQYRTGLWLIAVGLGVIGTSALVGPPYFKQVGGRLLEPSERLPEA